MDKGDDDDDEFNVSENMASDAGAFTFMASVEQVDSN